MQLAILAPQLKRILATVPATRQCDWLTMVKQFPDISRLGVLVPGFAAQKFPVTLTWDLFISN
jgi:hypothetical protein